MKISSLQENLKSVLMTVGHIAGKNVNLPILNNVLIRAESGHIKLTTTDLEIGIVATVRGKVEEEGVFTVDSRVLSEYIALLPNQKVDIALKDNRLKVQCDNYKTVLHGQAADEYPLIPQVEREHHYKVKAEDFKRALSQVIFSVSNSETRIELSGVLLNFKKDELVLAATDSYRLAERKIAVSTNAEAEKKIIVPAKTLQEVVRILSNLKIDTAGEGEREIEIYVSDNQILFVIDSIELISRLIEGQYPDYEQIIPERPETEASVDKTELLRAVKAAAIFAKSGINDINLDFPLGKNQITVTSESSQVGENTINLTAQVKGKDNGIVINFRYLLDGINNIDSEQVILNIIDGATPCVLKSKDNPGYLYVIMPIKQ